MNQQDAQILTNNLYFSCSALHVSDGLSVHHQEHRLYHAFGDDGRIVRPKHVEQNKEK